MIEFPKVIYFKDNLLTVVSNARDYEPLKKYEKFEYDQSKPLKQIAISEIYEMIKDADPDNTIQGIPDEIKDPDNCVNLEKSYTPPEFIGFYEMSWSDLRRYARQIEKLHRVEPPFNLKASRSEIEARIKNVLDKAVR